MRIAFVVPELHESGGTERCVAALITELHGRGHQITVFSARVDETLVRMVRWHRVPMLPRPHPVRFLSFFIAVALLLAWKRYVSREHYEVVHSTGPDLLRPSVTTMHCSVAGIANEMRRELRRSDQGVRGRLRRYFNVASYTMLIPAERFVVRRGAHRVVAVSRLLADELAAYHGVSPARIEVIGNGVDVATFFANGRKDEAQSTTSPAREVQLLFVGHNWERKGLHILVDALAECLRTHAEISFRLLVAGDRGPVRVMESIRARVGGKVTFLGRWTDVHRLYRSVDVVVLPTQYDAFGMPVLEAMASGVPVIVTTRAGAASVITPGVDGYLMNDPHDARELTGLLVPLLSDAGLRARIGNAAADTALAHSWQRIAAEYEDLYHTIGK